MSAKCGWCMPTLAAGALALAAVGCGGSSYSGSSSKKPARTAAPQTPAPAAAGQKLKLSADKDGGLYFEPKKLAAKTGVVTLVMTNPKTTGKQHGIAVKGNGVDKDGAIVGPGATTTITVTLKPGRYHFYCPFDGHAKAGMKGVLTVQ
ncbi:MAG: hypothetical protein E6G07_13080 [Actinobacteria bacterium]|nr:MAG: hypothetical protein E6G07_13080 [Actinomycetota bacterium]